MATFNRISRNQRTEIKESVWLFNTITVDSTTNNDIFRVFELARGVVILDAFLRVLTAGAGTTFQIDELNLVNQSGAVNLIATAPLDCKVLGDNQSIDAADIGVQTEPGAATYTPNTVAVQAVINTSAATGVPVVLVGIEVARIDYDT